MNRNPHKRLFSHYPLFQLSLAYSAGVGAANFVSIRSSVAMALCAASSLLVLALFVRGRHPYAGLPLLSSFFFAGVLLSTIESQGMPVNSLKQLLENGCVDDRQSVSLTGVLDQPPELSRDRVYLLLRLEEISS